MPLPNTYHIDPCPYHPECWDLRVTYSAHTADARLTILTDYCLPLAAAVRALESRMTAESRMRIPA